MTTPIVLQETLHHLKNYLLHLLYSANMNSPIHESWLDIWSKKVYEVWTSVYDEIAKNTRIVNGWMFFVIKNTIKISNILFSQVKTKTFDYHHHVHTYLLKLSKERKHQRKTYTSLGIDFFLLDTFLIYQIQACRFWFEK